MNIILPVAFKPITDEETLDTIIQSAWAEMTSIHINQTLIHIELSATHSV